jgi:hypothetical protein
MYLAEYLDKTFLQHILRIFPRGGEPVTYRKHLWTISVVQLPLRNRAVVQAALYDYILIHL